MVDNAVTLTQNLIIADVFDLALEQEHFLIQDEMVDTIVNKALTRVIQRIIHEMICLYNIDTAFKTADNVILNHLVSQLLIDIIHDGC